MKKSFFICQYFNQEADKLLYIGTASNPASNIQRFSKEAVWSPFWDTLSIRYIGDDKSECTRKQTALIEKKKPMFDASSIIKSDDPVSDIELFTYKLILFDEAKEVINPTTSEIDVEFFFVIEQLRSSNYSTLVLERIVKPEKVPLLKELKHNAKIKISKL